MRTPMHIASVLAVTSGLAACAHGAPPGYSDGTSWSAPLVSPLERGPLLVPVEIQGRGPYLFALDPDSPTSRIDRALAEELDLYRGPNVREIDESDTSHPRLLALIRTLRIGDLATVGDRLVVVMPAGSLPASDRGVRGVVGRDVLADSLVFGFDRAAGHAYLVTQEAFTPAAGADAIAFETVGESNGARYYFAAMPQDSTSTDRVYRSALRVATVDVGGAPAKMQVAFGDWYSALRQPRWAGTVKVRYDGAPLTLTVRPFHDRRHDERELDGTLGLDAFAPYRVMANWHRHTVYVSPRAATAPARRMARWQGVLGACATTGCAAVAVDHSRLTVERAGSDQPLEVLIEIADAGGRAVGHRVAVLPAGVATLDGAVSVDAASARILDVDPFPRACAGDGGCVVEASIVP